MGWGFDSPGEVEHSSGSQRRHKQGPALRARRLTSEQLVLAMFLLGDSIKDQLRKETADRGLAEAAKPDSHEVCFIPDGDTRKLLAQPTRKLAGPCSRRRPGAVIGTHDGRRDRHRAGITHGHSRSGRKPGRSGDRGHPPVWSGCASPAGPIGRLAQLRAHGELSRPRARRMAQQCGSAFAGQPVVSPGARRPCSMTMMLSWAAPRSTLSHGHGIESSHLTPDWFRLGARGSAGAAPRLRGRSARSDNAPTDDCGAWPFRPPPVTSRSLSTRPHRIGSDLKKPARCSKSPSPIASEIARCRIGKRVRYAGTSSCNQGADLRGDPSTGIMAIFSASALCCGS
jgi:hypothetical protein